MKRRSQAVSNNPVAVEAAREQLAAGGSAVSAVLAGFFAAAGAHAGVLLGPVSVLVGGVGIGARAFDGRLRQPGLGVKRPRGATSDDPIPDAARVAVPTAVSAVAVALAYDGGKSLTQLLKPGIQRAVRGGAEHRAGVLRLVRGAGAAAFNDTGFVRALLRVAGPSQGGQLSPADFSDVPRVDADAFERSLDGRKLFEAPWAREIEPPEATDWGTGAAICAVDVRRVFAALSFRRLAHGFALDELDLEAPLAAVPVRRGVTRVQPGARLAVPAPLALVADASGAISEVVAAPALPYIDALAQTTLRIRCQLSSGEVEIVAG
ncbi:MAG: hypothetical protein U0263_35805 [Polyangiaceae bacterium]